MSRHSWWAPAVVLPLALAGCGGPEKAEIGKPATETQASPKLKNWVDARPVIARFVQEVEATRPQWVPDHGDPLVQVSPLFRARGVQVDTRMVRQDLLNALVKSIALAVVADPELMAEVYSEFGSGPGSEAEPKPVEFVVHCKFVHLGEGQGRLELRLIELASGATLVEVRGPSPGGDEPGQSTPHDEVSAARVAVIRRFVDRLEETRSEWGPTPGSGLACLPKLERPAELAPDPLLEDSLLDALVNTDALMLLSTGHSRNLIAEQLEFERVTGAPPSGMILPDFEVRGTLIPGEDGNTHFELELLDYRGGTEQTVLESSSR